MKLQELIDDAANEWSTDETESGKKTTYEFSPEELSLLLDESFKSQRRICRAVYQINRTETSLIIKDKILIAPFPEITIDN